MQRHAWGLVLLLVGCDVGKPAVSTTDVDAAVSGGEADAAVVVEPDGSSLWDPSSCVEWATWPEQQPSLGQQAWGTQLIDIARHLPSQYGQQYWDDDAMTAAHETSHGIHAHLRNYVAPASIGWNAFYVLNNKAAFVKEPAMRKRDIKPYIAMALRGDRYNLYLEQQTAWDDSPLYVFDEWNAYVNGAEVAVGQVQAGLYQGQWTDAVMGPLEFTAYAIATAAAVKDKDPNYYATNMQFRCFTAWNIARAMRLYEAGHLMTQFEWAKQEQYAATLRTGSDGAALRTVAHDLWGAEWTQAVLGF